MLVTLGLQHYHSRYNDNTTCTGTNDLGNDFGAYTNLYLGKVEEMLGLLGKSSVTGNIFSGISGSKRDHISCVEDELFFQMVTLGMVLLMM